MNSFSLEMPTKIFFGKDQIVNLGTAIKLYGNKVLVLYGKGSIKKNGIYDAVVNELNKHHLEFIEFDGVEPNPRISTVRAAAEICKKEKITFILAVGGGSTIDSAKAIAVAATCDDDPWDFCSYQKIPESALPLGAVLTLSATGSEMNCGSVITNEVTLEKNGWGSPLVYPKFSILDPTYTYTVSPHQTACGIVDILTHLYEFYFNNEETAYLTDRLNEAVMKTVIKFGSIAIKQPENYEARANLMWASSMALNGITLVGKTFDGFNHGLEHVLSGIYDITHADGLSILAPHWMEYVLNEQTVSKLASFARNVWEIDCANDYNAAKAGIKKTSLFYQELTMPTKLSQLGIDDTRFDEIVERFFSGNANKTIAKFMPLTRNDVKEILNNAL